MQEDDRQEEHLEKENSGQEVDIIVRKSRHRQKDKIIAEKDKQTRTGRRDGQTEKTREKRTGRTQDRNKRR